MNEAMQARWHFFLAHAGPDREFAELLYDRLARASDVFLDSKSLKLGDNWDTALRDAQRSSLVTVVLISQSSNDAYYQREEIAAAIALAREAGGHRVVPVYLNAEAAASETVPYGLRLKHGMTLSEPTDLDRIVTALVELRMQLTAPKEPYGLDRQLHHDVPCPMCNLSDVERYESVSLQQFDAMDAGWVVGGKVRLLYCAHNRCKNCGNLFDDIEQSIPINYPSLRCQQCQSPNHLTCRVTQVSKHRQDFTFQAILQCSYCRTLKRVQRALNKIRSIVSLVVSSAGVSVERKPTRGI